MLDEVVITIRPPNHDRERAGQLTKHAQAARKRETNTRPETSPPHNRTTKQGRRARRRNALPEAIDLLVMKRSQQILRMVRTYAFKHKKMDQTNK